MRSRVPWILLLPALTGCYRYTPIEASSLQPGTAIRARVSAAEAERIEQLIGSTNTRLFEGVLLDGNSDALLIQIPTVLRPGSGQTLSQRISIPRSSVLELETRRLDKIRTWGLIAVGAIAGGFATYKLFHDNPEITGPDNGGGGGSEARIPLRLPIR